MPEHLYRFRTVPSLLGEHRELENQEIYFPSPEELNDPVEGLKEVFWFGDEVVWKNLFRHYLLCLDHVCALAIVGGQENDVDESSIPVLKTAGDLPTSKYKEIYEEMCAAFFKDKEIARFPQRLSSRTNPVRRNELIFYFQTLHPFALKAVLGTYEKYGLSRSGLEGGPPNDVNGEIEAALRIPGMMNWLEKGLPRIRGAAEIVHAIATKSYGQLNLIQKYNESSSPVDPRKGFIVVDFPEAYVRELERGLHPLWYAACFSASCRNPSLWSHYADGHSGVCLKFRAASNSDRPTLKLAGATGMKADESGLQPLIDTRDYEFYKVKYEKVYPEIDFFRSLGRRSRKDLEICWYSDDQQGRSHCAEDVFGNEKQWRKNYWEIFYSGITTKLADWKYEDEYRLILDDLMMDYTNPSQRKMRYEFSDLEGIVFGINTSTAHKIEIMKVIEKKCNKEGRDNFKFYQASYSNINGDIDISELSLLRFNEDQ